MFASCGLVGNLEIPTELKNMFAPLPTSTESGPVDSVILLPFGYQPFLISPFGFKGNLSLLEICFFSRGLQQMEVVPLLLKGSPLNSTLPKKICQFFLPWPVGICGSALDPC